MAAIMAAIMSTADSLLLQTGSIASRDLYQRFLSRQATDRQMVLVSRLMVLFLSGLRNQIGGDISLPVGGKGFMQHFFRALMTFSAATGDL